MTLLTDTRSQQTFNDFLLQFEDLPLYEKNRVPAIEPISVTPSVLFF